MRETAYTGSDARYTLDCGCWVNLSAQFMDSGVPRQLADSVDELMGYVEQEHLAHGRNHAPRELEVTIIRIGTFARWEVKDAPAPTGGLLTPEAARAFAQRVVDTAPLLEQVTITCLHCGKKLTEEPGPEGRILGHLTLCVNYERDMLPRHERERLWKLEHPDEDMSD